MTAIIDLPEKERKPRAYKKRKREDDSDSDEDYTLDKEYSPRVKATRRKKKVTKKRKAEPARRTNRPRDAMFACQYCDFRAETIGELNIHIYGNHDATNKPTFIDMAEATVAKLSER